MLDIHLTFCTDSLMSNLVGSVNCYVVSLYNKDLTEVRIVRYRVTVSGTGAATLECELCGGDN